MFCCAVRILFGGGSVPDWLSIAGVASLLKAFEFLPGVGATIKVGAARPMWSLFPAVAADAVADGAYAAKRGFARGRFPLIGAREIDASSLCAAFEASSPLGSAWRRPPGIAPA